MMQNALLNGMPLSTKPKILFGMRDDGDMTEPMNLMLLSALAKQQGFNTDIWVMERDDLKDTIRRTNPDIVAFSGITGSHKYYVQSAYGVKKIEPAIKIIVGGPHFTFFPGEILRHDCIDALCVGEGDDAWVEWLSGFSNNGNVNNIPNIVTKENAQRVLVNPSRSDLIIQIAGLSKTFDPGVGMMDYAIDSGFMRGRKTNLDDLPFLDRGLVYNNTEFRRRYRRTIMASRGCPFKCTYCFEHQWNNMYQSVKNPGGIRQLYSVDRLLSEIEQFVRVYDTRFIKFYDDVFPPFPNPKEKEWHQEFCREYPKRIGLPFHALTRCDLVGNLLENHGMDILGDWKKAGMASVTMSIESGNHFIRDHVIIRDMTKREIEIAFKRAWDVGLPTFPNTILGIPAPILPRIDDPDFDKKIEEISRQCKILREVNHRKIDLQQVQKSAADWFVDLYERRKYILNFLHSAGLHEDYGSYDKESVQFTLAQKPGFPEFPILAPYPKTKATEWVIRIGAFDGDFEKLHASYQEVSYLDCYDDEYKKVMHNYELLGSFLALFAGSRNPVMQWLNPYMQKLCLDYLAKITNPNVIRFYGWLYTVSKAYMHMTRIYPMAYNLRERWRFFKQMSGLDFWKQFKERKKPKLVLRSERAGQTLGGPPSI